MDWITELVKASPSNCAQAEEALNVLFDAKHALRGLKSKFQDDLAQNIADRDLSSEKVKTRINFETKSPKISG